MTSLLSAREGGLTSDAAGEFSLFVGRGALNVDTTVTVLRADDAPAQSGYQVLRTWRVDAHPVPVRIARAESQSPSGVGRSGCQP
jgi:hypothetical protein